MAHNYRYCTIIPFILTLGIIVIIPSAFAITEQVTIIPGAGSSHFCQETSTCFSPSILNISPGDTVIWTNTDNVDQTVTSGKPFTNQTGTVFDSGIIEPTKSYSFTFRYTGTYHYFSQAHQWMVGEVIVGPSIQQSPTVPEFGTLAGLIVLVSVTGVIAITRTALKS